MYIYSSAENRDGSHCSCIPILMTENGQSQITTTAIVCTSAPNTYCMLTMNGAGWTSRGGVTVTKKT